MEATRNPSAGDLIRAAIHAEKRRGRTRLRFLILSLILGGVAFAQKPAPPDDNIACSNKVQPTTGFTECEMLRLSNYMAQVNAIQTEAGAQIKPVTDAANAFITKVVDRNPGKQYESPSKQFPLGRLIPIPPPPPQPAPAAPTPAPAKK